MSSTNRELLLVVVFLLVVIVPVVYSASASPLKHPTKVEGKGGTTMYYDIIELPDGRKVPCLFSGHDDVSCDWQAGR